MEEDMPAAKPTVKRSVKTAEKPARKTAKKVTFEDVWAGLDRLEKLHEETEKALKKSHDETQLAIKAGEKSRDEIWLAIREGQKSQKETEKTLKKSQDEAWLAIKAGEKSRDEAWLAIREGQKSHEEIKKTLKKSQDEAWHAIKEAQRNINGIGNTLGSLVEHIMTPALPRKFREFGFSFDKITTVKWAAEGSIYTQIDGLLENGDQAMIVEVKTTLRHEDIDEHLERMEKVRIYADDHGDKRKFFGAIAATITSQSTREYALKKGLFVIEPSGDDVTVTKPVPDPKVW
jgi:lipocalin